MSHYDSCREAEVWANSKKEAYSYYEVELSQLGSAVELIKAIANGYGEDGGEAHGGSWATATPRQACDKWLMDHGYECEATRMAQRMKRRVEIDSQIEKLKKERASLDQEK